jgi:hypothetical protein
VEIVLSHFALYSLRLPSSKYVEGKVQNKKAELPGRSSFGSSAIFPAKIRRFPPPSRGGFGFIGVYRLG